MLGSWLDCCWSCAAGFRCGRARIVVGGCAGDFCRGRGAMVYVTAIGVAGGVAWEYGAGILMWSWCHGVRVLGGCRKWSGVEKDGVG